MKYMKWLPVLYLVLLGWIPININIQNMKPTDKSLLLGKFDPSNHEDFVQIPLELASVQGMYMQKQALESFKQMCEAARKDGIYLKIVSATRTFYRQKQIWENKWNGVKLVNGKKLNVTHPDPEKRALEILKYSSMPGTSRHHWGTDIDINSVENAYFKTAKGLKEYQWLSVHAHEFGFCQPYKEKGSNRLTGYEDEPWHWSYFPLSCQYTVDYKNTISFADIVGFDGDFTAEKVNVIQNFVFGIHLDCFCEE